MALGAVVVAALVLVASAGLLWIDHHNDGNVSPSDGRLTPSQYAAAVNVARTEIAQTHGKVSAAVATMVKARPTDCNAEGMLVVQLVRDISTSTLALRNHRRGQTNGSRSGRTRRMAKRARPASALADSKRPQALPTSSPRSD